jgi:uncharacterized membrane protein YqjE
MNDEDAKPDGWLDPLRRGSDSLLGLVQSRFELFAVELQEEKLRAINLLIWLTIALALGVAGLLIAMAALAIFLWNTAEYLGLLGLAVVTLAGAAGLLWWLCNKLQTGPPPFNTTLEEFKKDREWLRKQD